jgi:hypothetical protein
MRTPGSRSGNGRLRTASEIKKISWSSPALHPQVSVSDLQTNRQLRTTPTDSIPERQEVFILERGQLQQVSSKLQNFSNLEFWKHSKCVRYELSYLKTFSSRTCINGPDCWRMAISETFRKHLKLCRFERIHKQCGYFEKFCSLLENCCKQKDMLTSLFGNAQRSASHTYPKSFDGNNLTCASRHFDVATLKNIPRHTRYLVINSPTSGAVLSRAEFRPSAG